MYVMTTDMYDAIALEEAAKEHFGFTVEVDKIIVNKVDVSRTAEATVFLTKKKQLLVYISAQSRLVLSDMQKIVGRMGLKAELYLPPKGQPDYFDEIGRQQFRSVFPGRTEVSEDDIRFYRTLAPCNPALILISEVKAGEIYQYDSDARGDWRLATKFAYRRIRTS